MNEDVAEILYSKYWTPRRKLLLRVAVFYFFLGLAVGTVLFWG